MKIKINSTILKSRFLILGISITILATIMTFQNCTFMPGSLDEGSNNANPNYATRGPEGHNGGMPFNGKLARFQERDSKYCATLQIQNSGIRREIIRDDLGIWQSVDECISISARRVDDDVRVDEDSGTMIMDNRPLARVELTDKGATERIRCASPGGYLKVVVYESENGLTMHFTREGVVATFIPVTASHETGLNELTKVILNPATGVKTPFTVTTRYSAAFWAPHSSGQIKMRLESDSPGTAFARLRVDMKNGVFFENGAQCVVSPAKYPW